MARKSDEIKCRVFVNNRPFEELTPEEQYDFRVRLTERLENAMATALQSRPDAVAKLIQEGVIH